MISEALRQATDWGQQLVQHGMQVALDAKTVALLIGLFVGATVWINDRVNAGDKEVASVQSDVRVVRYEVAALQEDLEEQSSRIDSMDRRQIQYHRITLEQISKIADKIDAKVNLPAPNE